MGRRAALLSLALAAGAVAPAGSSALADLGGSPPPAVGPRASAASAPSDFNGDGKPDLAIGAPGERVGAKVGAGAVYVLYGSSEGLTADGAQRWTQDSPGITDSTQSGDTFGWAVASGDFDGDGFDDLAIGVVNEDLGTLRSAGVVHVLYGSDQGLRATGSQYWTQARTGTGQNEGFDHFGNALASGNFGRSAHDELAIGVPGETIGSEERAGSVTILVGSSEGLRATGAQGFTQTLGAVEQDDHFGSALAAENFGRSAHDELAVGAPQEDIGSVADAGHVSVYYGSTTGLAVDASAQAWTSSSAQLGAEQEFEEFGDALAAGDVGGSAEADLAIGAPQRAANIVSPNAGAVAVLHGAPGGLSSAQAVAIDQEAIGLDVDWPSDGFGSSLAVADMGRNGKGDLAIGAPGSLQGRGALFVVYSVGGTVDPTQAAQFEQQDLGLQADDLDRFGFALLAARFDGTGKADLAVGIPNDDLGSVRGGSVVVMQGTPDGITAAGAEHWTEEDVDIPGDSVSRDGFGQALA